MKTPEQWTEYYQTHHNSDYNLQDLIKDVRAEVAQALAPQAKAVEVTQQHMQLLKDNMLTKKQALVAQILCAEIAGCEFTNSRTAREERMVSAGQLADAIIQIQG